jgi:hypothetical protein
MCEPRPSAGQAERSWRGEPWAGRRHGRRSSRPDESVHDQGFPRGRTFDIMGVRVSEEGRHLVYSAVSKNDAQLSGPEAIETAGTLTGGQPWVPAEPWKILRARSRTAVSPGGRAGECSVIPTIPSTISRAGRLRRRGPMQLLPRRALDGVEPNTAESGNASPAGGISDPGVALLAEGHRSVGRLLIARSRSAALGSA